MFDRWRKLMKAFYSEKKKEFDISKVRVVNLCVDIHALICICMALILYDNINTCNGLIIGADRW